MRAGLHGGNMLQTRASRAFGRIRGNFAGLQGKIRGEVVGPIPRSRSSRLRFLGNDKGKKFAPILLHCSKKVVHFVACSCTLLHNETRFFNDLTTEYQ